MHNTPLVTVIIPSFNEGKYISQCLDCLLNQTYRNLEIIIIDDGSTDNTAEIVKQNPAIKYLYQENRGVSTARNRGIEMATGQFIHFMDADDLLTLNFYEEMIRSSLNTGSDVACCGFYFERFPNQSQRVELTTLISITEDKIKATNVCNYGACWRYIFKLDFLKKNKLSFVEGRFGEDRIFSLQAVFFANKIVMVPNVLYIYKNRVNAITTNRNRNIVKKRHKDRRFANNFQKQFASQHQFKLDKSLNYQHWQYKILGISLFTKRLYNNGKTRWFAFNIPIYQKKEIDLW
jgi:CDP-glycerol glycerophosphotransferase